ncbi:hypothetical protein OEZ85_011081 [Tetradesmus obliquus]|uniref:Uncharacterized protein n=1 Tax=Tetradesmus obliquus TaxID=3088 RepID=A0ABY8TP70_TETOB|nr:hypothetical protein OEZ85_011081 [Tetradesmus obliquus]
MSGPDHTALLGMQGLLTAHGLDPSFLSQDGWKAYTKSGSISSAKFSNKGPWYSYTSMISMYCDDPTLIERRRREATGRVEDLEAQLGEATRTAKERLLQVEDLKAQLGEATRTADERLKEVEGLEEQLYEATKTMEAQGDQVMELRGELNRAYNTKADLAAELVTVLKALAELRQRAAPVLDLVQPILTSDAEDVESRLDRLPELQRLAGQYAEQLNAARLSCRQAAKRKREQEDEDLQDLLCSRLGLPPAMSGQAPAVQRVPAEAESWEDGGAVPVLLHGL